MLGRLQSLEAEISEERMHSRVFLFMVLSSSVARMLLLLLKYIFLASGPRRRFLVVSELLDEFKTEQDEQAIKSIYISLPKPKKEGKMQTFNNKGDAVAVGQLCLLPSLGV